MAAVNSADHIGLVRHYAFRYARKTSHPADDLVQAGSIGLLIAAKKFDPTFGTKFSTYASWWILNSIHRHIEAEVAAHKGCSAKDARRHNTPQASILSLDYEFEGLHDPNTETLHDIVADDSATSVDDAAAASELRRVLEREMSAFPERTQKIMRRRFVDDLTLEEIGDEVGLTRERVRQIVYETLKTLRKRLDWLRQ